MTRRALLAALIATAVFAGCGGGGSTVSDTGAAPVEVPGGARPADVRVIESWAAALARGDVKAAAGYFAIPSVAENGALLRIRSSNDAQLFNASLPCGAHVVRAVTTGRFTTATFRLSERRGPGAGCGLGAGGRAQTSFVIRDGKIVQWRRVGASAGQDAPSQSA